MKSVREARLTRGRGSGDLLTAGHNADSPRFVSVAMKFGATTKRCGNR